MDDLTTLLHDAVEDVEPTDRLHAIRQQTRAHRTPRWLAMGGAVLAIAAVVVGIAIAVRPGSDPGPGPAQQPSATDTGQEPVIAIYYVGDTPAGPRLFREFQASSFGARLENAGQVVESRPDDPDYRSLWPDLALGLAHQSGDVVQVPVMQPELFDRPAGMSGAEAELAVQAVAYTVTANVPGAAAVQFMTRAGRPADRVLGVPLDGPVHRAPQLDVLALVNISDPAEGREVDGHFSAHGVASSFEGTVPWELRDADGTVVEEGSAPGAFDPEALTEWETGDIDVSGLAPGTYEFAAMTDDPSGGAEGAGPTSDTRSLTIR